ncbi:hypothetical protein BpHYR1_012853 [Brachionus plicatilis]|uniref:Uncharacterized protein n=1 Tax=Brachionus plicatilis TaxID=10195 RepID=A0A3M7PIJ3_BRAPC|nr:hypothetical protein BpHYR1_012853 [Brachionus plicatilis]
MAERLAVLDHENLEMLVFRAREHEGLTFGFSGIRERTRNMFNQDTGRHITEEEIRNLITPKNSYDNSFVNAYLSNMYNYSKLLNNSNDGSYLNSTIN